MNSDAMLIIGLDISAPQQMRQAVALKLQDAVPALCSHAQESNRTPASPAGSKPGLRNS